MTEAVEHADRIGAVFEGVTSRRLLTAALVGCGEATQAATLLDEARPIAIERSYHREVTLIQELAGSLQPR